MKGERNTIESTHYLRGPGRRGSTLHVPMLDPSATSGIVHPRRQAVSRALAVLLVSLLALGANACSDCEFKLVEERLDWRFVGPEESGSNLGTVGPGNVPGYPVIENAVLEPATAKGQLVGMMDAPRVGRMRLATFAITFPLAVGDIIIGNGYDGGGWGLLPADGSVDNGVRLVFEPALYAGTGAVTITQRLEVTGLSPLRLLLSWTHQAEGKETLLKGEITLSRSISHHVCD